MWKIIWKALAESMYYQNANIKNMYLDNIEYVNVDMCERNQIIVHFV